MMPNFSNFTPSYQSLFPTANLFATLPPFQSVILHLLGHSELQTFSPFAPRSFSLAINYNLTAISIGTHEEKGEPRHKFI